MAINFNNKYLQVLQNYDEFGEYSADYVRGEDHIAFLIEENEVIYWLYLEQVWRPLNVRTTKTGELEDGRTKVAVKLEYVEGGQKYTSVPNIPDPERITSMSHFLENYPDIEEVNVSGTVNLTDLSYAFAGSKIKDFSMLDTSNVNNIVGVFNNINDENLDLNIKLDINKISNNNTQDGITANSINFININKDNYVFNNIGFQNCNINILNLDDFSFDITTYDNDGLTIKTINSNKEVRFSDKANKANGNNEVNNINCDEFAFGVTSVKANNELIVNCNTAKINTYGQSNFTTASKTILETVNDLTFEISNSGIINFNFGSGIKYPSNIIPKLTRFNGTNIANIIGDFWFTTPIVNDNFYADKQYAVSIFQYKTAFTEVADVNISNKIDSNLLYANWYNVNDEIKNASIIINNIIDIRYIHGTYKNLIIDNSSFDLNENNCPKISGTEYKALDIENGYISGKYYFKYDDDFGDLQTLSCYKNILIYNTNNIIIINNNINDNNIKVNYKDYIRLYINNFNEIEYIQIKNLFDDNIIRISFYSNETLWDCNKRIEYLDNYKIELYGSNSDSSDITPIIEYLKKENTVYIKKDCYFQYSYAYYLTGDERYMFSPNSGYEKDYFDNIETLYVYCDDDAYVSNLIIHLRYIYNSSKDTNNYGNFIKVKNILGIINLYIDGDETNADTDTSYIHIDINKTKVINNASITGYNNLDDETTINLITKLIDNTSSSSKTIYMYRTQADIIGEENIAAAVAKNYEFAIIEN